MVRPCSQVYKYLTARATNLTIEVPKVALAWAPGGRLIRSRPMFSRHISFRAVVVSWILGVALVLMSLATALADGTGTFFPH